MIGLLGLLGCWQGEPMQREQLQRGCIVMLPGVEGGVWMLKDAVAGLRAAGVEQAIDTVPWGVRRWGLLGSLKNLTDLESNLQWARQTADRITRYAQEYPHRPVTLIGYSGGGGLAVLTAEALPEHVKIDRLILIAAAISPGYYLAPAMRHVSGELINFYSERDRFILGWGTELFGTIDRRRTRSAGSIGLRDPAGQLAATDRIRQVAWRSEWTHMGNGGGHIGWLDRRWSERVLAQYLKGER